MSKKCVKCNAILKDDDQFCTECGAEQPVEKRCPKCHALVKKDATFCTNCGAKLDEKAQAALAVPATPTTATNKWNMKKIGGIIGICVVVLVILVSVLSNSDGNGSTSSSGAISVKAEDMIDDYIRDQVSAEKKYKDKKVKITGKLIRKAQFNNAQDYGLMIYTKKVAGKDYNIILDVDSKNVNTVNKIKIGDFVSAEGTCVGIVKQKDPTDISIQIQSEKINQ